MHGVPRLRRELALLSLGYSQPELPLLSDGGLQIERAFLYAGGTEARAEGTKHDTDGIS
jgi:hypothetical protein